MPLGKTAYLKSVFAGVNSVKTADLQVLTRESILDTSAPFKPKRIRMFLDGVSGIVHIPLEASLLELTELTDIWVEASGNNATAGVSANLEIIQFDGYQPDLFKTVIVIL